MKHIFNIKFIIYFTIIGLIFSLTSMAWAFEFEEAYELIEYEWDEKFYEEESEEEEEDYYILDEEAYLDHEMYEIDPHRTFTKLCDLSGNGYVKPSIVDFYEENPFSNEGYYNEPKENPQPTPQDSEYEMETHFENNRFHNSEYNVYEGEISAIDNTVPLNIRLKGCPVLRDRIVWEDATGVKTSYLNWTPAQKARIDYFYQGLIDDVEDLGMSCPDPKKNTNSTGYTYLTKNEAFDVYAAHVAHALYLESEGLVPWSIASRPGTELNELLSSDRYHTIIDLSANKNYPTHIKPGQDFQSAFRAKQVGVFHCDPRVGFDFITGLTKSQTENLLGGDEEETLANLTMWMRDHVAHGSDLGGSSYDWSKNVFLKDRLTAKIPVWDKTKTKKLVIAFSGCHGASNIFSDLARSINIPLLNIGTQEMNEKTTHYGNRTHRGLIYAWGSTDPLVLWHTDDIYAFSQHEPIFPIDEFGNKLSKEDAKWAYFYQHWQTPYELKQWGFIYDLHKVYPGIGFGLKSSATYEDYANYGYFGGYWLMSDRQTTAYKKTNDTTTYSSDTNGKWILENQYQLCSYRLVKYVCDSYYSYSGKSGLQSIVDPILNQGNITSLNLPTNRTANDYWNRAKECATEYTCQDVNATKKQFEQHKDYQ